jgi:CheY-like chemotaxis protein/signal transduction histidine kinase
VAFLRRWFEEAARRKVWNVVAVYVALALGLLTVAEYLVPALLLPPVTNRVLAVLLLFGFPVAIVLAWAYDLTAHGLRRTEALPDEAVPGAGALPAVSLSARPLHQRVHVPRRELLHESPAPAEPAVPPDPARVERASLAQIRHDLSTPINAMIGYSEMLLEDGAWAGHDELRGELKQIREASAQILERIDAALLPAVEPTNGASPLDVLTRLPADLPATTAQTAEHAQALAGRAFASGLNDNLRDLQRIAGAAAQLHTLVTQIGSGEPAAASRRLERASAKAREVLASIRPVGKTGLELREGSLLVVDDSELNRDLLSRQLARQGYSVVSVGSGAEALARLAIQEFDLILLDVLMSGLNGLEVLRRLKAHDEWAEIPVLMISSLDELDSVVRCIEIGAEDYLVKPFDPVLLGARVRSNLRVRHLRRHERAQAQELETAVALNTRLLHTLAPPALAGRLSSGEAVVEFAEQATALYAEIDGLSNPGNASSAALWLHQLNTLFSSFDATAERLGIGLARPADSHAYLALTGLASADPNESESIATLALELIAESARQALRSGEPIHIRIGIHIGPALLGAPSAQRLRVHLGGEAIEVARQLAAQAQPDTAHLSTAAYLRLRERFPSESRGVTAMGADLQMRTFVLGRAQRE